MRAKKSLGQHFLTSTRALDVIIESGQLSHEDTVLEIGPGKGVLTERLLERAGRVVAIEKDDDLYNYLSERFKGEIELGKLELVHDDILNFDIKLERYKVVANIPYNITGALLEMFLTHKTQPELLVLLVQKEVAERIVARDGKESVLSISVKVYGDPKYVERVLAGSFSPAPKVDSAIILIDNVSKDKLKALEEDQFFRVVKTGFSSKRKKLSSNLSKVFGKELVTQVFEDLDIDDNTRAEDVDLNNWVQISAKLT